MAISQIQHSAASDPVSPDHVCTPACTHDGAKKEAPAPLKGTVRTTNAPTRPGEGSAHSSR
jgi:hypothetical protein